MNAEVLITGVTGFIGGYLARTLAAAGKTVVGFGRRTPDAETVAAGIHCETGDITDAALVNALIARWQPQTVYHLAAASVLQASSAAGGAGEMLRTNVTGTLNVLEACRCNETPVCIVASSDKQYGALATPPYDDSDVTAFLNGGVYELSKAQQDQTARLFAGLYDVPAVRVARLVNIYGPGDTQWTRIVPGTIRRTVQGEPPRITAGKAGEALREYVYVADAVTALRLLAADATVYPPTAYRTAEGKLARVAFNIGPGDRRNAAGVIAAVQSVLRDEFGIVGPEPIVQHGAATVFEPGSQFNRTEKLAALFSEHGQSFTPRSLAEGLRETIPWYLDRLCSS